MGVKMSAISCSEVKLGGKGREKGKGRKRSFCFIFLIFRWGVCHPVMPNSLPF